MMWLSDIAQSIDAEFIGVDCEFEQLSTDSRSIKLGDLFVALRGDNFDGHQFVAQSVDQGACAVVVDQAQSDLSIPQLVVKDTLRALGKIAAVNRRSFKGKVVGITGSSGKTTVKGMLASIFSSCAPTVATEGNFNNQIGVPLTLMRLLGEEYAVVELGTGFPGEIEYLAGLIHPDVALVTNILPAHIGGFGSLDAIADEKSKLYLEDGVRCAVINLDDEYAQYFLEKSRATTHIGYSLKGLSSGAVPTVVVKRLSWTESAKAEFDLCFGPQLVHVSLNIAGVHNVSNAAAAAACAVASGLTLADVVDGLNSFTAAKGRMQEKVGLYGGVVIDDSYNANPGSVEAAIDALSMRTGEKILVLGDMGELGEAEYSLHQELGGYASKKGIDALYGCGELASLAADHFGVNGKRFLDKLSLVKALKKRLQNNIGNTTVLVKGSRSSKMEEIVEQICVKAEEFSC